MEDGRGGCERGVVGDVGGEEKEVWPGEDGEGMASNEGGYDARAGADFEDEGGGVVGGEVLGEEGGLGGGGKGV